jgi:hypothetical protein
MVGAARDREPAARHRDQRYRRLVDRRSKPHHFLKRGIVAAARRGSGGSGTDGASGAGPDRRGGGAGGGCRGGAGRCGPGAQRACGTAAGTARHGRSGPGGDAAAQDARGIAGDNRPQPAGAAAIRDRDRPPRHPHSGPAGRARRRDQHSLRRTHRRRGPHPGGGAAHDRGAPRLAGAAAAGAGRDPTQRRQLGVGYRGERQGCAGAACRSAATACCR